MAAKFAKKWEERRDDQPIKDRLIHAVRPPGPLKPRLEVAIRRIEQQVRRLDQASDRFSERDKSIFSRIVDAYTKHDMARANVYANELAEIRKMEKMIIHAKLALEQIVIRLKTVSELGDVVTTLAPAVGVLHTIRTGMARIIPDAGKELDQIGTLLNGIIMDAGHSSGFKLDFEVVNDDAKKILTEASMVAEQEVKDKLPDLPTGLPKIEEQAQTETSTETL